MSQNVLYFGWVSKISFLTTWPKKRAPPKHYKIGVSAIFWWGEKHTRHETAILDQKTKIQKFQLLFARVFKVF